MCFQNHKEVNLHTAVLNIKLVVAVNEYLFHSELDGSLLICSVLHRLSPLGVQDGDATAAGGSVFGVLLRLGAIGPSVASLC